MWGQVDININAQKTPRIIPTRVGTRLDATHVGVGCTDHPHACGDKAAVKLFKLVRDVSSPRVWGQDQTPEYCKNAPSIIPTRVGTRLLLSFLSSSGTYHPHACGDKIRRLNIVKMHQVSSPRVWGQGLSALGFRLFLGIIPTRVGTSYTTGFLICQGGDR